MIISLDLDGTLLNSKKEVPETTMKYLNYLKNRGEIIVINTGRSISDAKEPTQSAWFANYIIGDTGATIYDVNEEKIIKKYLIDRQIGKDIFEFTLNDCEYFSIFSLKEFYYRYFEVKPIFKDWNCREFYNYDYIINNNIEISHISFRLKNQEKSEEYALKFKEKFKGLRAISMRDSFAEDKWIEIFDENAGKNNSLFNLANKLNIDRKDIISFGDAINDYDVVKESGIGVAMKNAVPELKQVSRYITDFTNDELGVENWLKNHVYTSDYKFKI